MMLRNCFVSLMKLGIFCRAGLSTLSMSADILSVGESMPETIGRPGLPGLCILGRR